MNPISITPNILAEVVADQIQAIDKLDTGLERDTLKTLVDYVPNPYIIVITGLRRCGKSTLLQQLIRKKLTAGYHYLNFEDERLTGFGAQDFSLLEKYWLTNYGDFQYYIFDEIQNVIGWERFVRRLHDSGKKVFVTGSNASLLSQELGTKLTGRQLTIELYPFSFNEFLRFYDERLDRDASTKSVVKTARWQQKYLRFGGIPNALKYPNLPVLPELYQDVLNRDVISRYKIESDRELRSISLMLLSNSANLVSLNKLKEAVKLGSVTTVGKYVQYLSNSWLIGVVNKYSYSVRTQEIAPKKVYAIDTGLINQVGFKFSLNTGQLLETKVYWDLRRQGKNIYYYKTQNGYEVDFYLPDEKRLIQVCADMTNQNVVQREQRALDEAKKELGIGVSAEIVSW